MTPPRSPLDGRFEVLEVLADQGYGEVWKARDTQTRNRVVALKLLNPAQGASLAALDDTLRRLKTFRHGTTLAMLHHGVAEGRPYISYELFEGPSLASGLAETWRKGSALPRALLERLADKLCVAVKAAHAQSPPLVHGGLHPGCVLLRRSSSQNFDLRVTDFGIAPFADPPGDPSSAGIFGVSSLDDATGVAVDVAGLGRVLRALFAAPAGPGLDPPRAGGDWRRDDLPDEVWAVVEQATAPRSADRFADIEAMRRALEAAWECPVKGPAARPAAPPAAPVEAPAVSALLAAPQSVAHRMSTMAAPRQPPLDTMPTVPIARAEVMLAVEAASAGADGATAVRAIDHGGWGATEARPMEPVPAPETPAEMVASATIVVPVSDLPHSPWDDAGFDVARTQFATVAPHEVSRVSALPLPGAPSPNPWSTEVLNSSVQIPAQPAPYAPPAPHAPPTPGASPPSTLALVGIALAVMVVLLGAGALVVSLTR